MGFDLLWGNTHFVVLIASHHAYAVKPLLRARPVQWTANAIEQEVKTWRGRVRARWLLASNITAGTCNEDESCMETYRASAQTNYFRLQLFNIVAVGKLM